MKIWLIFFLIIVVVCKLKAEPNQSNCDACESYGYKFKNLCPTDSSMHENAIKLNNIECSILGVHFVRDNVQTNTLRTEWYINITNKSDRQAFSIGGKDLQCRFNLMFSDKIDLWDSEEIKQYFGLKKTGIGIKSKSFALFDLGPDGKYTVIPLTDEHNPDVQKHEKAMELVENEENGEDTYCCFGIDDESADDIYFYSRSRLLARITTSCTLKRNISKSVSGTNPNRPREVNITPIDIFPRQSVMLKISFLWMEPDKFKLEDSSGVPLFGVFNLSMAQCTIVYDVDNRYYQLGPFSMCRHAYLKTISSPNYITQKVLMRNDEQIAYSSKNKDLKNKDLKQLLYISLPVDYQWDFDN